MRHRGLGMSLSTESGRTAGGVTRALAFVAFERLERFVSSSMVPALDVTLPGALGRVDGAPVAPSNHTYHETPAIASGTTRARVRVTRRHATRSCAGCS